MVYEPHYPIETDRLRLRPFTRGDVDAVFIITRNQHHASQAVAALEAGKHVFVEKPMALTVEECQLLEDTVRRTGKQLTVGFNRRFAPFYREQKSRLQGRSMPVVINIRMNSPGISWRPCSRNANV